MTPDDATWRGSRRRGLRDGAPLRPSRETRQQEALDLLRLGPVILWPHKHANPCGRIALRDLVKQGLVTMTIEDHLDLAAFARMEYTLRRCKVYRLVTTVTQSDPLSNTQPSDHHHMSTNINIVVQVRKGETWELLSPERPEYGGHFEGQSFPLFRLLEQMFPPPHTGWYPESAPSCFGYCHYISCATVEELRATRWGLETLDPECGFLKALHAEPIDALVAEHGGENVRIVFGFDA